MDSFSILLKVCGIALIGCVCLCFIGRLASGFSALLRIGIAIAVFGVLAYMLSEVVSSIMGVANVVIESAIATEALTLMLKSLGIALVAKLCADVCRDCGESGLAGGVESVGRVVILVLGLPLFIEILELVSKMLGSV